MKKILSWVLALFLLISVVAAVGVTEDIPISKGIAASSNYAFNWNLDDSDLPNFMDTQIKFQGQSYDVHDELMFITDSPSIETSLTSSEDDYGEGVIVEARRKSIYYVLFFDDIINVSKATRTEPLEVNFLGKKLKIVDAEFVDDSNGNKFKVIMGDEYFMGAGDVVTVDGRMVILKDVGADGSVLVDVDGTLSIIPVVTTKEINGIEVRNSETYYNTDKFERGAVLNIGKVVEATYTSDDPYTGEDPLNPQWKWFIGNLGVNGFTEMDPDAPAQGVINALANSGPYIGVYNYFRAISSSDNPAGVGECYYLPNNYAEICLDSLTVSDYATLNMELIDDSNKQIHINMPSGLFVSLNGINTDDIWLSLNDNNLDIYYKDLIGNKVLAGSLDLTAGLQEFAKINYQDTKDNNIILKTLKTSDTNLQIQLDVNGDSTDELKDETDDFLINWSFLSNDFTSLGLTAGLSEASELVWSHKYIEWWSGLEVLSLVDIGAKDEDHRSVYGIVIKNPSLNGVQDKIVLEIPSDQVQANVRIDSNYVPPGPEEPQTIYDINLDVGWNLFSIPLTQTDTTVDNVIINIKDKVDVIYGYEQGQWKVWRDGYEGNTLTDLEPGKSYFIKLLEPIILHIEGTIGAGEPPQLPEFNVYQGWNLIGYYGTKDVSAFKGLRNVDEKYSAIWSLFKDNVQSLQGNLKGMELDDPLIRTHGYWLYMQEDGIIVPTN